MDVRLLQQDLKFRPLTPSRWEDFEALFGERGACGGCWCMWWRLPRSAFNRGKGRGNKAAMRSLVAGGVEPGLLAYAGKEAVGWCAVAPRAATPGLERSRLLKPIDAAPVWSVTCFFVKKEWRGKGVSTALLRAAVAHVKKRGGTLVEGYPIDAAGEKSPDAFVWNGLVSAFRKAGFEEAARNSPRRPIMRYRLGPA